MSNPLSEQEIRDEVIASLVDYNTYVNSDVAINRLLKLIDKVGNQREVAGRIKHKLDELSLVPEHPDADLQKYKEDRRKDLRGILAQQGEQGE